MYAITWCITVGFIMFYYGPVPKDKRASKSNSNNYRAIVINV